MINNNFHNIIISYGWSNSYKYIKKNINIIYKNINWYFRDLSLMVKHMSFKHQHLGSNPKGLKMIIG